MHTCVIKFNYWSSLLQNRIKIMFVPLRASCLSCLLNRCTLTMTSSGVGMISTAFGFRVMRLSSRLSGSLPIPITTTLALASRNGWEASSSGVIPNTCACRPVVIKITILAAFGLVCDNCCAAVARAKSIRLTP